MQKKEWGNYKSLMERLSLLVIIKRRNAKTWVNKRNRLDSSQVERKLSASQEFWIFPFFCAKRTSCDVARCQHGRSINASCSMLLSIFFSPRAQIRKRTGKLDLPVLTSIKWHNRLCTTFSRMKMSLAALLPKARAYQFDPAKTSRSCDGHPNHRWDEMKRTRNKTVECTCATTS